MKRRDFIQKTLVSLGLVSAGVQIAPEVKAKAVEEGNENIPVPTPEQMAWDLIDNGFGTLRLKTEGTPEQNFLGHPIDTMIAQMQADCTEASAEKLDAMMYKAYCKNLSDNA